MSSSARVLVSGAIGALLLSSAACDKSKPDAEKPTGSTAAAVAPGTKKAENQPKEIEIPEIDGPVATVNGIPVPSEIFITEYKTTLKRYARARHPVQPPLRERLKDNIVNRLVDSEVIRQEAKKLGINEDSPEATEKWKKHRKRYGSEENFESFLTRSGTTEAEMERQFKLNSLREQVFAKVTETVKVTDEDLKSFYTANQSRYHEPEQVRASHILFKASPKLDDAQRNAQKQKAAAVLKDARKKGADFAALAKTHSEDTTKTRGGDLGFFTKKRMVKPFEEAAWKLKEGEISDIVETPFGFHIIKKTKHQAATQRSFEDVREQIARAVKARKRNETIRNQLKGWKAAAKIEIKYRGDPKLIKSAAKAPTAKPAAVRAMPTAPTTAPNTNTKPAN